MAKGRSKGLCKVNKCGKPVDSNQRCISHRSFYGRHGQDGGLVQCVYRDNDGQRCSKKIRAFLGEESVARCSQHTGNYCRYWQCPNLALGRGKWCDGHLQQVQKGAVLQSLNPAVRRRRPKDMSAIEWFAQYLAVTEEHPLCWTFDIGEQRAQKGHRPRFYIDGKIRSAYRWSYEYFTGATLRQGQEIDHTCRNTQCVNPSHLRMRADRAEHAAIESQRNKLLREHNEHADAKATWGADPESRVHGFDAFTFALQHRLPFKGDNISGQVAPKQAPIALQEQQELRRLLEARAAWLDAQGWLEETYSVERH